MTTYTAVTSGQRDAESPLDVTLIGLMIDNPIAVTEKAAGAPVLANNYVVEAMINAAAVSQGKLKTTDGSTTSTVPVVFTLPGGAYGFFPRVLDNLSDANTFTVQICSAYDAPPAPSNTAVIQLTAISGGTCAIYQRYISASKPYDHGDGVVGKYMFALVSSLGKVLATYVADEAPWHYNGPTNICPDFHKNGIGYQRRPAVLAEFADKKAFLAAGHTFGQFLDRLATDPVVDVEVTQAIKNADMARLPSPFLGPLPAGSTVVLLDPVSALAHRCDLLIAAGESVNAMMHNGQISIGNTALNRVAPPGVMVVAASLK